MDPLSLAVIVVALAAVGAFFLWLGRRLSAADAGALLALRAARAALEQQLAVALSTAERLPAAEAERRELAAAQMQLERRLAEEATLVVERTLALGRANDALTQALDDAATQRAAAAALRTELATLGETLAQQRQQAEAKLELLNEARATMTREFKLLADEILQRHGETFAKRNLEQLDGTLNPLRQRILEFQQSLAMAHSESEKERVRLAEQIKALSETSAKMSRETSSLTQALKGKSQTQGAWGEMILRTILEKSGLREGDEYATQVSHTNDEGDRLRPDVIVRLPNEQSIVIDAKVSLTAYAGLVGAQTEEERAAQLKAHVLSMRQHIRVLAGKEYHRHAGALDYVVMFVPIEGALAAALTEAPDLTSVAVENNVYIATPTTLMIALRTAANVWHVERRNRNAEDIATRAGKIYDKMFGFVTSMERLGKALESAQDQHAAAMGQLARGKGHVLGQLQKLKLLGARTTRSLPGHLLDDSDTEAPEIADETEEVAAE